MAKRKSKGATKPGHFAPALPRESFEVIQVFAIAGRAVCAVPENLESVTGTLATIIDQLVPPERLAAQECARLWGLFGRMVLSNKPGLLAEGGRALYRDLDALGQQLDLPPLPSWSEIPDQVAAPNPVAAAEETRPGESLAAIKLRAKALAKKHQRVSAAGALELVGLLDDGELQQMLRLAIKGGILGRTDGALIAQAAEQEREISPDDELLVELLEKLGVWLAS